MICRECKKKVPKKEIYSDFYYCPRCIKAHPYRKEKDMQTCTFCKNPESILTRETCCSGCSKIKDAYQPGRIIENDSEKAFDELLKESQEMGLYDI